MIGTHHSLSYKPIQQRWLRPFSFMARCQDLSISEQLRRGVTVFDFRIFFDNTDRVCFANGVFNFYSILTLKDYILLLTEHAEYDKKYIYVKITLEKHVNVHSVAMFRYVCSELENLFGNKYIKFFGGKDNRSGNILYTFQTEGPKCEDKTSDRADRWYHRICPRFFAKAKNTKIYDSYLKMDRLKECWMLDFINIY